MAKLLSGKTFTVGVQNWHSWENFHAQSTTFASATAWDRFSDRALIMHNAKHGMLVFALPWKIVDLLKIALFEAILSTKTGVHLWWMKLYNVCEKKETERIALQWVCIFKGPDIVGHVPRSVSTLCLARDQLCRSILAYETKNC